MDRQSQLRAQVAALVANTAVNTGGGLMLENSPGVTGSGTVVSWRDVAIRHNVARFGGGVFWTLDLPFPQHISLPHSPCIHCMLSNNTGRDMATSAFGVSMLTPQSTFAAPSGMLFAEYAQSTDTILPVAAIVDLFGQPTAMDSTTQCAVEASSLREAVAGVLPLQLQVESGVIPLGNLQILADLNQAVKIEVNCPIQSPLQGSIVGTSSLTVRVVTCLPGWDLTDARVCRRCLPGTYSTAGLKCLPCPEAALCEMTLGDKNEEVLVGVVHPVEQEGFWMGPARQSIVNGDDCAGVHEARLHPDTGVAVCNFGERPIVRNDGSVECESLPLSEASPELLFACGEGLELYELYECPSEDACEGGSDTPHSDTLSHSPPTWFRRLSEADEVANSEVEASTTCREGHVGILCARCEPNWVMSKSEVCEPCPENFLWLYATAIVGGTAVLGLWGYIDGGNPIPTEEIAALFHRCCSCFVRKKKKKKRKRLHKLHKSPPVVAYAKRVVKSVIEQPDKYMLLVSFVQVCSEFASTYTIPWPDSLMNMMKVRCTGWQRRLRGLYC